MIKNSRRSFLKKAAYTAPAVIGLGSLINPVTASAASSFGPNDSSTNTFHQQIAQENGHTVNGESVEGNTQHWDEWAEAQN